MSLEKIFISSIFLTWLNKGYWLIETENTNKKKFEKQKQKTDSLATQAYLM